MKEYSRLVNTRTMLGWNPVTKDFKNISFLLSFCFCSIHASTHMTNLSQFPWENSLISNINIS